jgi:hypothetical protein
MPSLPVGISLSQRVAPTQTPVAAQSRPATAAAPGASRSAAVDSFEPAAASKPRAVAGQTGTRPADGLKAYEELSPKQQALLGEGGAARYAGLGSKERAAFMVLTTRMEQNGLDSSGMKLKPGPEGIQQDRLLFDAQPAEAMKRFEGSVRSAISRGDFLKDKPSGSLHGGGMNDFGARQWVTREAMQVGLGPGGAFVDIDRFGPRTDLVGIFGHIGEILTPGKTDPFKVARSLKIDVQSHLPEAK